MVTKKDMVKGLIKLGLEEGDSVLVHSSLSSFGYIEEGADTVISALMEVVGQEGGVLMPSFPAFVGGEYGLVEKNEIVFDIRVSPSLMGKISDAFWRREGVRRSIHPTHSVAAWGNKGWEIIEGHEKCLCSCGEGSPFHRNCLIGGKILFLGTTHSSSTTLHTVEDVNGAPTRSVFVFYPKVIDCKGRVVTVSTRPHLPGLARQYEIINKVCRENGIQKEGKVGNAVLKLIEADGLLETGSRLIRKNPLFLINMEAMR